MQETVLITGASTGIGASLAQLYAQDGYQLILVARSKDKLDELAAQFKKSYHTQTIVIEMDLQKSHAAEHLKERVEAERLEVDILINNAGYGLFGEFADADLEQQTGMIDLNVRTLTRLSRLFLPEMLHRKKGVILNVASVAAFQPGPLMAVYYASKAYVLSFSEALANELQGSGVQVSVLCPGPTSTPFQRRAKLENSKLIDMKAMDVHTVARQGYEGVKAGKTIIIPGWRNRFQICLLRFFSRAFIIKIVRRVQEKR